jgi:hypothetical protein
MNVLNAGKFISQKYYIILTLMLLLLLAVITGEVVYGIFSNNDPGFLYEFGKSLAGIGILFGFTALLLFPVRRTGRALKNRVQFFSSRFFTTLSAFIALIHPVIGVCAFICLFTHGFIFLKVVYGMQFTLLNSMGAASLLFLTILLASGSVLKKKLSSKQIRRIHITCALLFITFFILHKSVM